MQCSIVSSIVYMFLWVPVDEDTSDFEITMTQEEDEKPPEYSQASRFPVSNNLTKDILKCPLFKNSANVGCS